jgi:ribosome maturation protein Sdo1
MTDKATPLRTLLLALLILAMTAVRAQTSAGTVHLFLVDGITSGLLEKQCQEALLGLDPDMAISIDTANSLVKVRTQQSIPSTDIQAALEQLGLTVSLVQSVPVDPAPIAPN